MRLSERLQKIKEIPDIPKDFFVLGLIIATGVSGFFLGRMSLQGEDLGERAGFRILGGEGNVPVLVSQTAPASMALPPRPIPDGSKGAYVGSKNGTTYHLPWCSGAARILEANKVWFTTKGEAEAKGYRPAANCKGI